MSAKSVARFLLLLDHKDALRDRNLVALGNFRKPDALDIKNSYGLLEFRRTSDTQKPWKLWRGDKSYTVDEPSVQSADNRADRAESGRIVPRAVDESAARPGQTGRHRDHLGRQSAVGGEEERRQKG